MASTKNRSLALSALFFVAAAFACLSPLQGAGIAAGPQTDAKSRIEGEKRLFSLEVRDAEITDVLRALAQQSGFNIIIGEGVTGKVSVSFRDIAFKDALEMIIKANGLAYTIQNNVFWVGRKVDTSEEIEVEIIRLNDADPVAAAANVKGVLSLDGTAIADARTNSVIIRDLRKNIVKARALLKTLDRQTAQVVIEARIVEASNSFSRQLGVQWGGQYTSGRDSITGASLLPTSAGGRNFAVNLPAGSPTSGLGLVIGNITQKVLIDMQLSAAESRGELKIISNPRVATLNNKEARIHSGLTFRVKLTQTTQNIGAATTAASTTVQSGLEEIKTGIDLTVTPKISENGYILLSISTNKSDPDFTHVVDGIPGVSEKSASTYIMVKDGDTVVIGGLFKAISAEQNNAVPFLEGIPLLGALFKSMSRNEQNEELLVFITPRIIKYDANTEVPN